MIVDGKKIAEDIFSELDKKFRCLSKSITFGVLVSKSDLASTSYVSLKERVAKRFCIDLRREWVTEHSSQEDAVEALRALSISCDVVVVQLPLPAQINANELLACIPTEKDIDALSPKPLVLAPVAAAVAEILRCTDVKVEGKRVVVVGSGRLVGAPVARMLRERKALVEVVTLENNMFSALRYADIVVSGAGSPHLIKPGMLKTGVVLVDAGTSESQGRLVGDVDPACATVASVITPVPGGVGPVAVAMLFRNILTLCIWRTEGAVA